MLDFNQMVRNTLWEMVNDQQINQAMQQVQAASQNSASSTNQQQNNASLSEEEQSKQDTSSIFRFLTTGSPVIFEELKTLWKNFKNYKFCNEEELNIICANVVSFKPRSTKSPEKFSNIQDTFPLLDLIACLYEQNFKGKYNIDKAPDTYKTFKTRLEELFKTNKYPKPLDYNCLDPWAQSIKTDILSGSKQELGKLRLNDQPKPASIYELVFNLLAIRKKILFPKLTPELKMLNGQAVVDKIMLQPWSIVKGTSPINNEKIRSLYDDLTVREIVDVSLAAYKLFVQQAETFGVAIINGIPDENLYKAFMGKGGAKPVPWSIYQSQEQQTPINASFDQTFELINKQLLGENNNTDPDYNRRMQDAAQQPQNPTQTQTQIENPQQASDTELKAFEIKPGEFVYNFELIQQAKTKFKIVEASNLLKELEGLANYIKTKEQRDILGAINQIVGAMSLGVKL